MKLKAQPKMKNNAFVNLCSSSKNTSKKPEKHSHLHSIAIAISLAFAGFSSNAIQAQTFTVTNTNDQGSGSLRRAVFDANSAASDDNIVFDPSLAHSPFNLSSGEISIGNPNNNFALTITGFNSAEPNSIIIDAGGNSRIFNIDSSLSGTMVTTLENMTLTGGNIIHGDGGAINAKSTDLTLNNMVITGNTQTRTPSSIEGGGGIRAKNGELILNNSIVSGNTSNSKGGGIYSGTLILNETVIIGNQTTNKGGGIRANNAILNNSTVSHNTGKPSAISAQGGSIELNQSTISNNTNSTTGANHAYMGTINLHFGNSITVNQSTITNNTASVGSAGIHLLLHNNSTVSLFNSILAANSGAPDGNISYSVSGAGTGTLTLNVTRSLFGDALGEINGDNDGVYPSNTPNLGVLQSNGGPTPTLRPDITSPAFNSGSNALVTDSNDQRGNGFERIQGVAVDMGAVERQTIINGGDNEVIKRGEMARAFLEKISVTPPIFATGMEYHDVQAMDSNANWIVKFGTENYTEGCAANKFCPDGIVTREAMAKIYLKISHNSAYTPNPAVPEDITRFNDVNPTTGFNADWIFDLPTDIGLGCEANKFCPKEPVTRKWFEFLLSEL